MNSRTAAMEQVPGSIAGEQAAIAQNREPIAVERLIHLMRADEQRDTGTGELAGAGYITRRRNGRRNNYTINAHFALPDAVAREQNIGQLLDVLTATRASGHTVDPAGASG